MYRLQRKDLAQVARGFLMGGADIIPGVSGGTVALILGIYERLVTAVSHIDGHLLSLVAKRQWRAAAEHFDFRFLVTLAIGVLSGIACLAGLMHYLLLEQRMYTLAVFFGLILASSFIVMRLVRPRETSRLIGCYVLAALAAVFAFWLVGLEQIGFRDHPAYYFFCGTVAICAMILPGISGSYILLLFGAYEVVTGMIKDVLKLQFTQYQFVCLLVFSLGCAVGLIGFSKLLKWLLARFHMPIMAILGGFMIGSLRLIWPFQEKLALVGKKQLYGPIMPQTWNSDVTLCLMLALGALAAVLSLERWGSAATGD